MKSKKTAVWLVGILTAIVLGLVINGWFNAGQALTPAKEHIKIDAREIVLGDSGDSEAGNRNQAAGPYQKKNLRSVAGASTPAGKTITLAYTYR